MITVSCIHYVISQNIILEVNIMGKKLVSVKGYKKSNGTTVRPHRRRKSK